MTDQDSREDGSDFDSAQVDHELAQLDPAWPPVRHSRQTGSTNADALAAVAAGAPAWTIMVADCQTQGRGRLDRRWDAPSGTALLASVVLRLSAGVRADAVGWVPLLVGLSIATAVRNLGVPAEIKWPNDVVVHASDAGARKLAGILVERHGEFAVAGFGVNCGMTREQLPVPTATSLLLENVTSVSRERLLVDVMIELRAEWTRWLAAGADAERSGLRERYLAMSATVGQDVAALLPNAETIRGRAAEVDHAGHLVIDTGSGRRVVAAGDVTALRPAGH